MLRIITPLIVIFTAATALAGRYESFTQKAAQGDKLKVVAATYFGGPGIDEFVAAGALADDSVVAFGNAWGPEFPDKPAPVILGKGEHRKLNPYVAGAKAKKAARADDPDAAGMIVVYDQKLSAIKKVIRFDWGVASIATAIVASDGKSLILTGRCTGAFRALAKTASVANSAPAPTGKDAGPYAYDSVECTGDIYIASLAPDGGRLQWVWIFEGQRLCPDQLWADKQGAVYGDVRGMIRISPDGKTMTRIATMGDDGSPKTYSAGGPVRYQGVDPADGSFFFGGDRNTNTGHQPWRQPYLYKFDNDGKKLAKLWEWKPSDCACGGNGNGLCSDSSPRCMDIGPDGDMLVAGWSDGGNSVFTRWPTDVTKGVKSQTFGMDSSGMKSANSLAYIMRIDPKTFEMKAFTMWLAYIPDNFETARFRGAPNFANIGRIRTMGDGSIAFTGSTATGLIQTPNAFYKSPGDGRRYGGPYVAAFSADMKNLLFSSHLPGCEEVAIGTTKTGLIAVSRSKGVDDDEKNPTASPTVNALQDKKQGDYDGHIVLLER